MKQENQTGALGTLCFNVIMIFGGYDMLKVSTPSRICLFGEHQDYLGLEVIASGINLRFSTKAEKRDGAAAIVVMSEEKAKVQCL